ncbi:LysM peptidoglycan-binding domain-containing protein [Aestuariibacter halophilus]|uniref:LysM peptidoglycan-binding domain-containing protein n=1 Tax=Fluctibacter halophilus TaxID=226011 RepID=A0ABS8G7X5_9ALTE|nr:LysM peptidoglycan-binding domain-containing protein [Aestuariibacter halophilus]MCC2616191.1 LysM peptidoglycan-binding domain-containing protein [Aestuariibacter halophilus]
MRIWMCLTAVSLLSGCQLTPQQADIERQQEHEHQVAATVTAQCHPGATDTPPPSERPDDYLTCDNVHEGTIPVSHPVEEVEVAIETAPPVPLEIVDVWERVRQQLTFAVPDNRRVNVQRDWYLRHPDYMQRVAKRARPFMHLIVEMLEQENMPLELALLPIVESAFDPFAYSHGRAAGMWQFIPGTGKRFGMKQTWWYDGRRDVIASTEGAIAYLRYLLNMFDGNWLHALAAYNSGEGRVLRAIRKNKRAGKDTDFWSLDLPRETRAYVPKLLALSDILANHEKYAFAWPHIDNQPVVATVDIGSQLDLALAADMAGLTLKELHALNPGFNRWATDPDGPHRLLVPLDRVSRFNDALAKTDKQQRLNWVRHKVRNGDSLLKLAKEYHTTVDVIQQVNEMRGNMIRVGDHLLVPVALKSLDSYALSQEQRLAATQSTSHGRHKLTHRVVSGDTMWDLSREFNVGVRELARWNGMAPTDPLHPGKTLVIWVDKVSDAQRDNAVMRSLTYTVRRGDSLARIAGKFNVRVSDIQRWNQIDPKKYLQPGQKLKLYVDVTRT